MDVFTFKAILRTKHDKTTQVNPVIKYKKILKKITLKQKNTRKQTKKPFKLIIELKFFSACQSLHLMNNK